MVHGQNQEDQTARARRPVARLSDHGYPAKFIEFTMAPDAETAEEQVAEAHDISDTLRDRLVAIRED
jgi:hypothetical protein